MKEKTLKDVHAGIREFYNRAVDFERKENWEFAISCMLEVVLRVPAFTEARQKLRLSQSDLAARLQIAGVIIERDSISRIEIGTRFVADYEVAALARALKVSVEWLLEIE